MFFSTTKEASFLLDGPNGAIEAVCTTPAHFKPTYIAVLGHPHPLHQGTMNNKVVTTMARAFRDEGIASVRFNFRGVGQSEGVHDDGMGESEDMLWLVHQVKNQYPDAKIIFAGFSFGTYVTYRAACQYDGAMLISIAPSVTKYDYTEFKKVPSPWYIAVAMADDIVDAKSIIAWHKNITPAPILKTFDDASHFFHGKLVLLKESLQKAIKEQLTH